MEGMAEDVGFIDQEQLSEIRRSTNWKALFEGLGLRKAEKRSKENDWWAWSPFKDEKTPSFHMSDGGRWYDFSIREGGGVIELLQRLHNLDCYEAGRMLLEHGWASTVPLPREATSKQKIETNEKTETQEPNPPIRQTLLPLLSQQGTHQEFISRGISKETCEELGCGLLDKGRSSLKGRIVFQVRGVEEKYGELKPVILSHIGRATTKEQADDNGKWRFYKGFRKSLELYNIDKLLLNEIARQQVVTTGHVLIVEGPFDVAKCWEAGIFNIAATFGADFSGSQMERLHCIQEHLKPQGYKIWFDRDEAGTSAQNGALTKLAENGFSAEGFDWEQVFRNTKTDQTIVIPEHIKDPCDMSVRQLRWLRANGVI